jgi:3-hydroxybutyryl-CoA dehydratase
MDFVEGQIFNTSFNVTENVYNSFLNAFNDRNILHTDMDYAKSKGFKSKVMHGNILGGFLSYFIGQALPVENVIIQNQYIKYSKPFYLNDTLNFRAEITHIFESINSIEFKYVFKNTEEQKIASGTILIGII